MLTVTKAPSAKQAKQNSSFAFWKKQEAKAKEKKSPAPKSPQPKHVVSSSKNFEFWKNQEAKTKEESALAQKKQEITQGKKSLMNRTPTPPLSLSAANDDLYSSVVDMSSAVTVSPNEQDLLWEKLALPSKSVSPEIPVEQNSPWAKPASASPRNNGLFAPINNQDNPNILPVLPVIPVLSSNSAKLSPARHFAKLERQKQEKIKKVLEQFNYPPFPKEKYKILEELGSGGFGHVYKIKDTETKQEFALKKIDASLLTEKAVLEQHLREAQVQLEQNHPFICKLFNCFKDAESLYYILELVPKFSNTSPDLYGFMENNSVSIQQKLGFFAQMVLVFQYLQNKNVIYRDLKPENVLIKFIEQQPVAILADFGLAKKLEKENLTSSFCHTPAYAAPEQFSGQSYSIKVDNWKLGIFLYELITQGDNPGKGELKFNDACWQDPEAQKFIPLIQGLLDKNPDSRWTIQQVLAYPQLMPYLAKAEALKNKLVMGH